MSGAEGSGRIPLQLSQGCVVASIQVDLSDEVLALFKDELLELLHRSGARGVILDVSGVEVMDLADFEALRRAMSMASVMGARCLLAGLRPGVVSALVDMGVDSRGIEAALNLDEAFRVMNEPPDASGESDRPEEEQPEEAPTAGGEDAGEV
jgi:rsbT antagonist protein RsbS